MASGWSMSAPLPIAVGQRQHAEARRPSRSSAPAAGGDGRSGPARPRGSAPRARRCSTKSSIRMPFLATMPTPMIAPRKETTFSDVPVIHSASTVPNSASTAPKTMASGSRNERNSISSTVKTRKMRHRQHEQQVAERLLLLLVEAAELDRAGRQIDLVLAQQPLDLRHRAAQVAALEARGDGHVLPQVLAAQLELARLLDDVGDLRELAPACRPARAAAARAAWPTRSMSRRSTRRGCSRRGRPPARSRRVWPSMAVFDRGGRRRRRSGRSAARRRGRTRRLRVGPA